MADFDLSGFRIVRSGTETDNTLREKRVHLMLTQKDVAIRAGITTAQYQKFESGTRNIRKASFDIACSVLQALEMDISSFFENKYALGEEIYLDYGLRYKKGKVD